MPSIFRLILLQGRLAMSSLLSPSPWYGNTGRVTRNMPQSLQRSVLRPYSCRKVRRANSPFPLWVYGRVSLKVRLERGVNGSRDIASIAHTGQPANSVKRFAILFASADRVRSIRLYLLSSDLHILDPASGRRPRGEENRHSRRPDAPSARELQRIFGVNQLQFVLKVSAHLCSGYNDDHRHSGIGMLTPAMVHFGQAPAIREKRQIILDAAYLAHPDRFVRRPPIPLPLPKEVWINKPQSSDENTH